VLAVLATWPRVDSTFLRLLTFAPRHRPPPRAALLGHLNTELMVI
jgi:hypothetical protein